MAIRTSIDSERRLAVTVLEGIVTDEDVRASQRGIAALPGFDPAFDHLVDMTRADRVDVSLEVRMAVAEGSVFNEDTRRALVAAEPHQLGFARQHALLRSGDASVDQVRVFTSREEAEAWLGLR